MTYDASPISKEAERGSEFADSQRQGQWRLLELTATAARACGCCPCRWHCGPRLCGPCCPSFDSGRCRAPRAARCDGSPDFRMLVGGVVIDDEMHVELRRHT